MHATVPAPTGSWQASRSGDLPRRHWAGEAEAVVYDPATGQTHLVDELSHALLADLEAGPRTVAALAERFVDWFEPGTDREARERYLREALGHLHAARLVSGPA